MIKPQKITHVLSLLALNTNLKFEDEKNMVRFKNSDGTIQLFILEDSNPININAKYLAMVLLQGYSQPIFEKFVYASVEDSKITKYYLWNSMRDNYDFCLSLENKTFFLNSPYVNEVMMDVSSSIL